MDISYNKKRDRNDGEESLDFDDISDPDESEDENDDDNLNNDDVEINDIGVEEEPLKLTHESGINYTITKVRKIVKIFRRYPKRNSILQT